MNDFAAQVDRVATRPSPGERGAGHFDRGLQFPRTGRARRVHPGEAPAGSIFSGAMDERLQSAVDANRGCGPSSNSLTDDEADQAGLSCGGSARLLVQPATDIDAAGWAALASGAPVCLITELDGDAGRGERGLHRGDDRVRPSRPSVRACSGCSTAGSIRRRARAGGRHVALAGARPGRRRRRADRRCAGRRRRPARVDRARRRRPGADARSRRSVASLTPTRSSS